MTTKAIVMTETGGPEVLKLREIQLPVPAASQVRVAVRAVGVNPVETYWRSGTAGRNPKLPYTPGRDASGIVDAVGPNVKKVKVGDRVFSTGAVTGAYAHHFLVGESDVHKLPDVASFEAGASLGTPAMAAYRALFTRGQAKSGENLFIHGASGGVGLVAIQLAKAHGMTVTGTADNQRGVELLKRVGCDHAYIHLEDGYFKKVAAHGPFDVIIEVLANVNLANDLTVAAKKGRIVIVGSRGTVTINPRDIMTKELEVKGLFLTTQTEEQKQEAVAKLVAGLDNKTLKPVVAERLSLDQVCREACSSNSNTTGTHCARARYQARGWCCWEDHHDPQAVSEILTVLVSRKERNACRNLPHRREARDGFFFLKYAIPNTDKTLNT